jgi:hypothetical protein
MIERRVRMDMAISFLFVPTEPIVSAIFFVSASNIGQPHGGLKLLSLPPD